MKKILLTLCCGVFLLTGRDARAQLVTFSYTGAITTWTVPCGVTTVNIQATGAGGGANGSYTATVGGLGASMQGTFTVTPSEILSILVGGKGTEGGGNETGGGGGGSFVVAPGNSPLIIAGGGGGGGYNYLTYANATTSTAGNPGGGTCECGTGGTNSGGGGGGNGSGGGGGGGLTGNGGYGTGGPICGGPGAGGNNTNGGNATGVCNGEYSYGGSSFTNGGAGGTCASGNPTGGFGGGGAGSWSYYAGGGGGGGYSGGGAGGSDAAGSCGNFEYADCGGGGGSYNGGSSQTNTAGVESGNGQVIITWTVPTAPVVTAHVVSNVSCNGGSNGSANETITGGSTPFTYLWTPSSQTNATATGLSAGTYTIGVTDACGNTASASVAITQPASALMASASTSTNVTCNAGSNGATASTVSGGTTPYTYAWTGGSTNATATGLSAGTYTLNVTDMNGCSATASAVITQPNALAIDTTFTTANVLCHGDSSGSAFTTASGGTMPYTYLWTPGGGTTDTAVGLKAGSYTITVSDACGASATAMVSITEPTAISATLSSTPDNGSSNGTATVSATGGNLPYTFLWSPGGNTTGSISGKDSGTYCCKVTDANGCIDNACVHIKSIAGIQGISSTNGQITVYPNPNNGQFTIASSISGASTVEIYNILGEKVFTKNLSTTKGTNQVNVSNQPNGVYLYRVISENGDLLGQGKITLQK